MAPARRRNVPVDPPVDAEAFYEELGDALLLVVQMERPRDRFFMAAIRTLLKRSADLCESDRQALRDAFAAAADAAE
jgi:hypothetical protein